MAEPTWTTRELPILEAIAEIERRPTPQAVWTQAIAEMALISKQEASLGFRALAEDGYLAYGSKTNGLVDFVVSSPRLLGKGRRAIGQWPPDGIEAILRVLEERIGVEADAERRSRLVRVREALADLGQDVLRGVLTDWARRLPDVLS